MGWGAQEQQRKTVARELSEAREASQQWLDKAKDLDERLQRAEAQKLRVEAQVQP